MIKSPFKKLFITASHSRERQATDSKKLSAFAGLQSAKEALPQAHEHATGEILQNIWIGRVRSIVNYDKTYGTFLWGFANICAVSNSVIYDWALLWWNTGTLMGQLSDASVPDIDRNGNRLMPFRFFFSFSIPLLYFFVSFSAWKGNQEQAVNRYPLLWATQCWVIERNHWRICEDRPYFRRWWTLRRREGRWNGYSCVVIFVMKWSSTKNHRSLLDLSEVGAGEEQEKHSRLPKKGRLSSEKVDIWPQGKIFAGLLCNRARAKRKQTKNKK